MNNYEVLIDEDNCSEIYILVDWENIKLGDYVFCSKSNLLYEVVAYQYDDKNILFLLDKKTGDVQPMQSFYEQEFYQIQVYRKVIL